MLRVGADFSAVTTQSQKASKSVGSMMSAISRSTSKLNSAISGMNKVLGAAGIAVSLAGIVSAAKNAAAAFNEVQENNAALAQVMKNTMGATKAQWQSVLDLADAQQRLGVIDAEVTKAGAVELATYLGLSDSLETLLPVMNDMLAQQYGMAASAENATNIATMLGKVMNGQTGALSRYGYSFTAAQEAILKYGDEAQRAAVLAQVVEESVGGMNQALAQTPSGRLQQVKFALGDIQEAFGKAVMTIATAFLPLLNAVVAVLQRIAAWAGRVAQAIANVFGAKTKTVAAAGGGIGAAAGGINDAADAGDNLSDAMGGAAKNTEKAAKAAQKLGTMSFDELNMLNSPSQAADTASGGSGGSDMGDVGGSITGIDWSALDEAGESSTALEKILERLKKTVDKMDFSNLEAAWGRLRESAKALGDVLSGYLKDAYDKVLEPLAIWTVNRMAPVLVDQLADALYALGSVLDWLKPALDWLWDNALGPATEHLGRVVADFQEGVGDIYRTVGDLFSGKGLDSSQLVNAIGKVVDFFSYGIFSSIADVLTMMGVMDDFNASINETLQDIQGALDSALHWVENSIVNPLIRSVQRVRNAVQEAIASVMQLIGVSSRFDASGGGGSSSWGKIGRNWKTIKFGAPHFAEGGVMQSAGLFVANENGVPEMVGRMGHHAAVANNGQIQDGIAAAVLSALLDTGMLSYIRSIADSSERTARKEFTLGRPGSEAGRWVSRSLEAYDAVRG
nr:MAG TPA: hypothetical protein [Caudoviricetes sp.]